MQNQNGWQPLRSFHRHARRGPDRRGGSRLRRRRRLLTHVGAGRLGISCLSEPTKPTLDNCRDKCFQFLVEMQLAAIGPGDGLHGQVVRSGAESAGRDDKVEPVIGEEAELRG